MGGIFRRTVKNEVTNNGSIITSMSREQTAASSWFTGRLAGSANSFKKYTFP